MQSLAAQHQQSALGLCASSACARVCPLPATSPGSAAGQELQAQAEDGLPALGSKVVQSPSWRGLQHFKTL